MKKITGIEFALLVYMLGFLAAALYGMWLGITGQSLL